MQRHRRLWLAVVAVLLAVLVQGRRAVLPLGPATTVSGLLPGVATTPPVGPRPVPSLQPAHTLDIDADGDAGVTIALLARPLLLLFLLLTPVARGRVRPRRLTGRQLTPPHAPPR
jgi:hypothetical protein